MIAFLFPGQGAQTPGMLHALDALAGGAALVAAAGAIIGRDPLAEDTIEALAESDGAQRALLIAGVASARALIERGVRPDAVAGHSVGAFAAAVVAESLDFEVALRLVDLRGRAMASAFPAGYGMGAISGLDEWQVSAIVAQTARRERDIYAANRNAPDQIAIAGSLSAVDATLAAAHAAGARSVQRLNVAVPSHSPLMAGVTALLERALDGSAVSAPRVPYAANATGRIVRSATHVRTDLIEGASKPVRWADATCALYEFGVRTFIEMHPGRVLTDLAAAAFPDARCLSLDASGIASALAATRT